MSILSEDEAMTTLAALRQERQAADDRERLMRLVMARAREAERFATAGRLIDRVGALLRGGRPTPGDVPAASTYPRVAYLGCQSREERTKQESQRDAA